MTRLMMMLFSFISTTLMGSAVVVVLAMGMDTVRPIALAALAGFVISFPVSWFVARQILSLKGGSSAG